MSTTYLGTTLEGTTETERHLDTLWMGTGLSSSPVQWNLTKFKAVTSNDISFPGNPSLLYENSALCLTWKLYYKMLISKTHPLWPMNSILWISKTNLWKKYSVEVLCDHDHLASKLELSSPRAMKGPITLNDTVDQALILWDLGPRFLVSSAIGTYLPSLGGNQGQQQ